MRTTPKDTLSNVSKQLKQSFYQLLTKKKKKKAAYNISVWLIWLGKDEQAKQFMQEYAQKENDEIMMEAAQDFPEYKRTVRFRNTFN